jgi:multidrug resistance efflux pump
MNDTLEKTTTPNTALRRPFGSATTAKSAPRITSSEKPEESSSAASTAPTQNACAIKKSSLFSSRSGGLLALFCLSLLIAAAGVLFAPGSSNRPDREKALIPPAAEAGVVLAAVGRSEPVGEERTLAFAVSGLVRKVWIEEGRTVKQGDLLAELVNDEERAAVGLAEAEAFEARSVLIKTQAGPQTEEIQAAEAEAERARLYWEMLKIGPREEKRLELEASYREALTRVENARSTVERLEPAFKANSISREVMIGARDELKAAEAGEAAAKARLVLGTAAERPEELARAELAWRSAKLAWEQLKSQPRPEDVKTAEARVAVAEARRAAAQAALAKTTLFAPFPGVVLQLKVKAGERVEIFAPSPIMVLGDLTRIRLRVEVDENDVGWLSMGQPITALARGLGEQTLTGHVVQIGRRMGRKRLFTDLPDERIDTHVLEVLAELDGRPEVPVGYRFRVLFHGETK